MAVRYGMQVPDRDGVLEDTFWSLWPRRSSSWPWLWPQSRPGATGDISRMCPPKRELCPPKQRLCPKEINRLDATGAQIKVWDSNSHFQPEMESSGTSLASRTHFEVLGLEASSPRKLPCPRFEDSTIFEPLKFHWKTPETLRKICKDRFFWFPQLEIVKKYFWRPFLPEKIFWNPFFFFVNTCICVLGPWPRDGLFLALPRTFLCPWPWLRALCSWLHLCFQPYRTSVQFLNCTVQRTVPVPLQTKAYRTFL